MSVIDASLHPDMIAAYATVAVSLRDDLDKWKWHITCDEYYEPVLRHVHQDIEIRRRRRFFRFWRYKFILCCNNVEQWFPRRYHNLLEPVWAQYAECNLAEYLFKQADEFIETALKAGIKPPPAKPTPHDIFKNQGGVRL
jgi:hypothetical protein